MLKVYMKNLKEILELSESYLRENNLNESRYDAQFLLANYFSCSRLELYLKFDRPIAENELVELRRMLKRRASNEPLQYITGKADFFGYTFFVDKNVLIPRLDSETLVVEVLNYLGVKQKKNVKILDIGTGSGCLPITIFLEARKKRQDALQIIGMDISEEAVKVARKNADFHETGNNISFFSRDLFGSMKVKEKFDIVISNPPYISFEEMKTLDKEVRNFEPIQALTDKSDGLTFYKRIAEVLSDILKVNGSLFVEIGMNQGKEVEQIFKKLFQEVKIIKDLSGRDRIVAGYYFIPNLDKPEPNKFTK